MTDDANPMSSGPPPPATRWLPDAPILVRAFAVALAAILVGYMFMGRGFAHIGIGPVFIGDVVLALGVATAGYATLLRGARPHVDATTVVLVAFMGLGAIRTVPYLGTYGLAALRDGVLWGYAAFALIVALLADRAWLHSAARAYGVILPVFAVWLPICLALFVAGSAGIDPTRPGEYIPLVFFKAGDMAVHSVGAVAALVLVPGIVAALRPTLARFLVSLPLTWTIYVSGAASRGAILAAAAGIAVAAVASGASRRLIHWTPVLAAAIVVVVTLNAPNLSEVISEPPPTASPEVTEAPTPTGSHRPRPTPRPTELPTPSPPTVEPTEDPGRAPSIDQWLDNLGSIVGASGDGGLQGTVAFRLAWWSKIVDYTVFGPYFWAGKGFGVNLANDDGFQPTADQSLRAPHNSHMTVLARMGVPGAILWVAFQALFGIGLLRAILRHRRAGDQMLAALGVWILVTWAAMNVVTSFDPYLEGPQGGIWFWVIVGLGLVVTQAARSPVRE